MNPAADRTRRVISSMLWSAWADALGFISELTDEQGLRRRLKGRPFEAPVEWTRRVGGRFGVQMEMPAGCYSDDTQLRLATARAISSQGFDVEAFARVELPTWPSYALGGGRASKAAATNLSKPSTPWFGNLYDGFFHAGGNGVAMRIQPHVWAAQESDRSRDYLVDVIVNGVVTHGHPRALVGAVLHAVALDLTLRAGRVPTLKEIPELLDIVEGSVEKVYERAELSSYWSPLWEAHENRAFVEAWREAVHECREMLEALPPASRHRDVFEQYEQVISALHLREESCRGSGTNTVLASLALATIAPEDAQAVSLASAHAIGTDTDTIATMAAAMVGIADERPLPSAVMDIDYLTAEATKLARISLGQSARGFTYPDLFGWSPPKSQLDAVGIAGHLESLALTGIAWIEAMPQSQEMASRDAVWQWMTSDIGASFLAKRRYELRTLPEGNWPVRRSNSPTTRAHERVTASSREPRTSEPSSNFAQPTLPLGLPEMTFEVEVRGRQPHLNIDQVIEWVTREGFRNEALGYAIRRVAQSGTAEQMIAFAAEIRSRVRGGL